MKQPIAVRTALLMSMVLQVGASGGSLHKVWQVDLGAEIRGSADREQMQPGILALRFSPDGKEIAISGNAFQYRPGKSRLIVVQIDSPKAGERSFDMPEIASDSPDLGIRPPAIAWSPTGKFILAGSNLVNVGNGETCRIPSGAALGFISTDRIAVRMLSKTGPSRLDLLNLHCESVGTWQVAYPEWALADTSAERGLVALLTKRNVGPTPFENLLIANPVTMQIVRRWTTEEIGFGYARFGEGGTAVCAGDKGEDLYEDKRIPPRCARIDTGERIAEARGIVGGAPLAAADRGSRVIFSDHSHTFNIFYREYDTALKARDVWDLAKNQVIASWRPGVQSYSTAGLKPNKGPFAFAISSDGDYVAEGGNGTLTLYKIEP